MVEEVSVSWLMNGLEALGRDLVEERDMTDVLLGSSQWFLVVSWAQRNGPTFLQESIPVR